MNEINKTYQAAFVISSAVTMLFFLAVPSILVMIF